LNLDEIKTNINGEVLIDGLIAYYNFKGDNPLIDKSGNGYNATAHGNIKFENKIIFVPEENYDGKVSFEYTVSDGNGGEDVATVNF
jgi:hypothetical protein